MMDSLEACLSTKWTCAESEDEADALIGKRLEHGARLTDCGVQHPVADSASSAPEHALVDDDLERAFADFCTDDERKTQRQNTYAPCTKIAKSRIILHVTMLKEASSRLLWPRVDDELKKQLTVMGVRVIAPLVTRKSSVTGTV